MLPGRKTLQLKSQGNQFDTALLSFHAISIDARPERRYSEPIYSKDLVTMTNSTLLFQHPIHVVFPGLHPGPQFLTTNSHMLTVSKAGIGGNFSA